MEKKIFFYYLLAFFSIILLTLFINRQFFNKKFQDLIESGRAQIWQLKEREIEGLKKEISRLEREIEEMKGREENLKKAPAEKIEKENQKIEIEEKKPKIEISLPDEIFSGQEFEVFLSASNLEDGKYDLKISIEKEQENISEIYDQKESKWKSSFYYLEEFFSGNSFQGKFKIRVSKDFEGFANLIAKLRNSENKKISAQFSKEIEILKPKMENQIPIASFSFSPRNPKLAQEVFFDASFSRDPDGQISKFIWDFGDGNFATTFSPTTSHSFLVSGDFEVSLIVVDDLGKMSLPEKQKISVSKEISQTEKENIFLSFPSKINLDEEFEVKVSISNLERKIYDLKISVEKDGKTISKIFDPEKGWKSSYYYILNAFEGSNFESQFKMKVESDKIEKEGLKIPLEAEILVKVRENSTKKIVLETSDKILIE